MDSRERTVRLYVAGSGESPFEVWFEEVGDRRAQERILARIARLRLGNVGDWRSLREGVFEMRLDYGPGYRLYFGQEGMEIVILLVGGTKSTQERDIKKAKEYWHEYQKNKKTKTGGL